MFQVHGSIKGLRHLGNSVAIAASLLMVTACTSTTGSKAGLDAAAEEAAQADVPVDPAAGPQSSAAAKAYRDPQVAAVGSAQQEAGYPTQAVPEGQPGPIIMQSTGLKATSNSIFAAQPARALVPAQRQATGNAAPMSNSLFNAGQPQQEPMPVAAETDPAKKIVVPTKTDSSAEISSSSATPAENEESAKASIPAASAEEEVATVQHAALPAKNTPGKSDTAETLSIGGLFGLKRKARGNAPQTGLPQDQVAALGYTAWPSSRSLSMFATVDDNDPGHDDESPAIEMASLPGLARLAPNGLWLQTEKVETGCFKPELMGILKSVENHYGEKVIVTSGHRDVAHNVAVGGAPKSRHITCEAADIQVPGITKWDLAAYLRTLPGRGGVGTYCHTQSVHVDVGRPRDWNWSCTAKS